MLGVSAITHTFCRDNLSCQDNEQVRRVIRKLEEKISLGCNAVRNRNQTIVRISFFYYSEFKIKFFIAFIYHITKNLLQTFRPTNLPLASTTALYDKSCPV